MSVFRRDPIATERPKLGAILAGLLSSCVHVYRTVGFQTLGDWLV